MVLVKLLMMPITFLYKGAAEGSTEAGRFCREKIFKREPAADSRGEACGKNLSGTGRQAF